MEKKLIHFDQYNYDKAIAELNFVTSNHLQPVLDCYINAKIPALAFDEMPKLLEKPREFIIQKLIEGKTFEFGGMKLSNKKAGELLELSKEQEHAINIAISASKSMYEFRYNPNTSWGRDLNNFAVEGEKVVIKSHTTDQLNNVYSIYTDNEKQIFILDKVERIAQLVNEINQTRTVSREFFQDAFIQGGMGGEISIRPDFVKSAR